MSITYREIIGTLSKLHLLHRINIQRTAADNRLYLGQLHMLDFIIDNPGCTQKEMADYMQITPPSIASALKRMEKAGLLKKEPDEMDLRRNHLTVTQKGLQSLKDCRKAFDRVDELVFRGFSSEECDALYGYLNRLMKNIETDEFKERSMPSLIDEDQRLHPSLTPNQP